MRKPIIAGNWKMHKTGQEAEQFVEALKAKIDNTHGHVLDHVEVVLCAPFIGLPKLVDAVEDTPFRIGAQNMHWEKQGAYTGEVSPTMLADIGVHYVILGHSERRAYFAETDETVNKKVHAAFEHNLVPIVCVGEHLTERESRKTKEVVKTQVELAVRGLTTDQANKLIIAYEPIWAIGTGKSSTSSDANEVITFIREVLTDIFNNDVANNIRIQYGGSVKPENIHDYMAESDIDGALVGGASLEPETFGKLIEGASWK